MDTSGILIEEKADGSIRVGYVDYGVDFFGGRDYESFYDLDSENAQKLRAYFNKLGFPDLLSGLKAVVGENFSDKKFCDCCKEADATYKHTSWS